MPSTDWDTPTETVRNNAGLVDNNANQGLDAAAIEGLRAAGKSGEEIVAALAAASKTFESKTEFAQEKYKRVPPPLAAAVLGGEAAPQHVG